MDSDKPTTARPFWGVLLRDVQFWVPVAVLIGGLFVLRWIS